jgi:hypothetical protein
MNNKHSQNSISIEIGRLDWTKDKQADSLQAIYNFVIHEAEATRKWYIEKSRVQRRWARLLRISAIITTTLAGLIPLLSQLIIVEGKPLIAPAWASAALVVSVFFIALDKFFGFSSSWARFILTELKVRISLHNFLMDWQLMRAKINDDAPSEELLIELLTMCKLLLIRTTEILTQEADEWRQEFMTVIRQIDENTSAFNKNNQKIK